MDSVGYPETDSFQGSSCSIKHKSSAHNIAIPSVYVTNPAGPTKGDEGHSEHLLMKMNFLKLDHKRAETAKCLFGWRARGKEGAERKRLHGR